MTTVNFTLIDAGHVVPVAATLHGDRVWLSPAAVREALGWELKPQGLCKDDCCLPLAGDVDVVGGDGVDLGGFAALLARPLALDVDACVAYLGTAAVDRAMQLASLHAPDFSLPDLNGQQHTLSDYRGKKVLLVAYASW
jgi:hypothetical protein